MPLTGDLARVQVKTSTCRTAWGRFVVRLETRGGNQSWNGITKHFDPSRCDYLFVLTGDGGCWFIPANYIQTRSTINLGGGKYGQFEVERAGLALDSDAARGDVRVVKGDRL